MSWRRKLVGAILTMPGAKTKSTSDGPHFPSTRINRASFARSPRTVMSYLWIFLGGGLGSLARFAGSGFIARLFGETFPWGTLLVNVTGSFIIGWFAMLTGT